jgi:hypothetical protein
LTQFAIQLLKKEARILTDQIASDPKGNISRHYKCRQLNGYCLTGRGGTRIFDLAEKKFKELDLSFDDAVQHLPDVMRDSLHEYALELMGGEAPEGYSLAELIELFKEKDKTAFQFLNTEGFLVGYSEKHKCFGVASVWSYRNNFELSETYKPGFMFLMQIEPVKQYARQLGRKPESKKEMAEALRRVYQAEKKLHKDQLVIGGGDIDCTIIKKDGIAVENLGPLEKSNVIAFKGKNNGKKNRRKKKVR